MNPPEIVEYGPRPHEVGYTFGGRPAVVRVTPGTTMRIFTEDCFGGRVRTPTDLPSRVCRFAQLNPVTGPFHVAGAEPGDTLALHLVDITPARDWGISATFPHFGALTSTPATPSLQPPLEERVWRYPLDVEAGMVRYAAGCSAHTVDLPLAMMLGTVGVAPAAGQVRSSVVADTHGGNLDIPQLRAATTLYLPVFVDGALFAIGDGHARQGAGEVSGVAVEIATHTTLIVEVIKGVCPPVPRLESDTHLMSIGCARPLEDAFRISQHDLVGWVMTLTGLEQLDAYQLIAQAGHGLVANVCDPTYTMLAAIDKTHLPGAAGASIDAYGGVHQRLRAQARQHQRTPTQQHLQAVVHR